MAKQAVYAGHPRRFIAAAMPQGDVAFGVAGPLVQVVQLAVVPGHKVESLMMFTREEAAQLRDQLDAALRAFSLGAALVCQNERPVAAVGYPFRGHRTVADCEREAG